jgi:hypothetical protein
VPLSALQRHRGTCQGTECLLVPHRPCSNPLGVTCHLIFQPIHFSAAESGFQELLVIQRYRTVTCCEIGACAILTAFEEAARLYVPATC